MASKTRRSVVAIALGATSLTVAAIGYAIFLSLDSRNYFFYWPEDRAAWTYDAANVALYCGFMLAATTLAAVALFATRPRTLAVRCLVALAVLVPWALYVTAFIVHAPGYVLVHHLWLWLLIALLVFVAFASFMHHLYSAYKARKSNAI